MDKEFTGARDEGIEVSIRPYLLRAWYEWFVDMNLTPQFSVYVDKNCHIPNHLVKDSLIVFNVSPQAVSGFQIKNIVTFNARFSGVSREVMFPVGNVIAIFDRENRNGMSFRYFVLANESRENSIESESTQNIRVNTASHLKIVK